MAKRQKTRVFSFQGFDNAHYKTTAAYTRAVNALFDQATNDIADAASKEDYNPDKPFAFEDYPKAKARLQTTIKGLAQKMQAIIELGSRKQWLFACQKNDAFIASIFDTTKLSKGQLKKMQDRNLDALQSFQQRKVGGMTLSERVWKYTQQYQEQIEIGLDVGLGEGRSAQQLSRDLRQNLQDPNRLFRRVRDKRGNLQLSKVAKAFHPGTGVYRSSYKNAMRLTRSEINMAYREADHLRWQQLDFVLGFEVRRSNREPQFKCTLCDTLVGKYPKSFKFKGWHPQCMCYCVPILEDFYSKERSDDRVARLRAALNGTEHKQYTSKELITDYPEGFKAWVEENAPRQAGWKSTPYFIRDNFIDGDLSKGLIYVANKPLSLLERAALRHEQRTPEQIQAIQARWDERKKELEAKRVFEFWNQDKLRQEIANTKITRDELRLIDGDKGGYYTKTPESWDINAALRANNTGQLRAEHLETIRVLDKVIARNHIKQDMMCYRYDSLKFAKYLSGRQDISKDDFVELFRGLQGQVITDLGYRSVSSVEGLNAFSHYPIRFNIRVKAGTPAYVADNFWESEIVFGRGTKIKVLSVHQADSKTIVECELL